MSWKVLLVAATCLATPFVYAAPTPASLHGSAKVRATTNLPQRGAVTSTIRKLLGSRKYGELNSVLAAMEARYRKEPSQEYDLFTAYNAFVAGDQCATPKLDAWVMATPEAPQAYLARLSARVARAWGERGGDWASETSEKQIENMRGCLNNAALDLQRVLVLDEDNPVVYRLAMEFNKLGGVGDLASIAATALKFNPESSQLRKSWLHFSKPRWGGSLEAMEEIVDSLDDANSRNPEVAALEGYMAYYVADALADSGSWNKAAQMIDEAMEEGDVPEYYYLKARIKREQEDYKAALAAANKAIDMAPETSKYYTRRYYIRRELDDIRGAADDLDMAARFPGDEAYETKARKALAGVVRRKGYDFAQNARFHEAIKMFDLGLHLVPEDADMWYRRAQARANVDDLKGAMADVKRALKLNPGEYSAVKLADWILTKDKKWGDIIAMWDAYIQHKPHDGRAWADRGGAKFHKGDIKGSMADAKHAAELGNRAGREAFEKYHHLLES